MYDKEVIYDEKIFPLMSEIIKICKENDIQMLASFALRENDENGNDLACTTYLQSKEYTSSRIEACARHIYKKPSFTTMIITDS